MSPPVAAAAMPLHRHQLAHLTESGWQQVFARAWDEPARECLAHWARARLPLVVTRQGAAPADHLAMGLPTPLCWGRRRIALSIARTDVLGFAEFPLASAASCLLPAQRRADWRRLCDALAACGTVARVYGSFGWQLVSGLACVRPGSDVDLWSTVHDRAHADRVCAVLRDVEPDATPRLDGELVFPDGSAVAWREWSAWRAARTEAILVKRIDAPALLHAAEEEGAS